LSIRKKFEHVIESSEYNWSNNDSKCDISFISFGINKNA